MFHLIKNSSKVIDLFNIFHRETLNKFMKNAKINSKLFLKQESILKDGISKWPTLFNLIFKWNRL